MLATALLLIGTFTSAPGESMDQFVTRVSPEAVAYTAEHKVEVCGAIGQDGPEMTLVLTTDGNAMECKVSKVRGKFTGFIFHTHTSKGNEGWANADLAVPGYLATPRKLLWQNQNKMRKLADY
jgi:hypothetical protein